MILILFVALAVPLGAVSLGLTKYFTKPIAETEAPELREAMEQAADRNWNPPASIKENRPVFYPAPGTNPAQAKATLLAAVQRAQGSLLEGNQVADSFLVQISASEAKSFEAACRPVWHSAQPTQKSLVGGVQTIDSSFDWTTGKVQTTLDAPEDPKSAEDAPADSSCLYEFRLTPP